MTFNARLRAHLPARLRAVARGFLPGRHEALVGCCFLYLLGGLAFASPEAAAQAGHLGGTWNSEGPGPMSGGQVEGIAGGLVAGAVQALAAHPSNPKILYAGTVNGGIWRTDNATSDDPSWRPLTDDLASLSISSLAFDPSDAGHLTLVAGIGLTSSYGTVNGGREGLLRTADGGTRWQLLSPPEIRGRNVAAVVPRGREIFFAVDDSDFHDPALNGIYSVDGVGGGFHDLSGDCAGAPPRGRALPAGRAMTLAARPSMSAPLWAAMICTSNNADDGLYRRELAGGCWQKVSSAAIDRLFDCSSTGSVRLAFGPSRNVYLGLTRTIGISTRLAGVFHSGDGGATWTDLGLPVTLEPDGPGAPRPVGLHPGGQGDIHFSLAADPVAANVFYLGGDRQPLPTIPNSIGAHDYSGRLFRGRHMAGGPATYVPLTHSNTTRGSAPHADSRALVFDASGRLLEADDGGVYHRTSPLSDSGDWESLNGDLRITELHNVVRDPLSGSLFGGAQDTGVPLREASTMAWTSLDVGDGGDALASPFAGGSRSRWYWANESMRPGSRGDFDSGQGLHDRANLALYVASGRPLDPNNNDFYFTTPMAASPWNPRALVIGTKHGVYESMDSGDHLRRISVSAVNQTTAPLAFGARNAPYVLYVASDSDVLFRERRTERLTSTAFSGGEVEAVAVDPEDGRRAFALAKSGVFFMDRRRNWQAAGILPAAPAPGRSRSFAYFGAAGQGRLLVGDLGAVWIAFESDSFARWFELGDGLPRAPVNDLVVDAGSDQVLAAVFGRGAFSLPGVVGLAPTPPPKVPAPAPTPGAEAESLDPGEAGGPAIAATDGPPMIRLLDGVWVDPAAQQLLLMAPEKRLESIDLRSGAVSWSSVEVSKPLLLTADRKLVAQAEGQGDGALRVGLLDIEDGPRLDALGSIPLPDGVVASIDDGPEGSFEVIAAAAGNNVRISWLGPGPDDADSGRLRRFERIERAAGQALLELDSGRVRRTPLTDSAPEILAAPPPSPIPLEILAFNPVISGRTLLYGRIESVGDGDRVRWRLEESDRVSGKVLRSVPLPVDDPVAGRPAADGKHVLVAAHLENGEADREFLWCVFEASGELAGTLELGHSGSPFVVVGDLVVTELPARPHRSPPRERRIVALDIENGGVRWQVPLRDPTYRGPRLP